MIMVEVLPYDFTSVATTDGHACVSKGYLYVNIAVIIYVQDVSLNIMFIAQRRPLLISRKNARTCCYKHS